MPIAYTIDESQRLVTLSVGNTSLRAWRATMQDVFADARFAPGFALLVDCRTATLVPSVAEAQAIVAFIEANQDALGHSRWAVLANFPAGYGMARMTERFAEAVGLELRAFTTADDARQWLLREEKP